jgi:hypothetical protein
VSLSFFSRGVLFSILVALLFVAWVKPATAAGLLLLVTVYSMVFYLFLIILHVFWVQIFPKRSRVAPSSDSRGKPLSFVSGRKKFSSESDHGEIKDVGQDSDAERLEK